MSLVVGIDPSLTNTGIAALLNGAPIAVNRIGHGTRNGNSYAHRSDRIVSQCRAVIDTLTCDFGIHGPKTIDLAVMEGPAYGANLPSAHDRAGLFWGLYSALRAKHVPTVIIPPATAKKWATGHGDATKKVVLCAARQWWPGLRIADDNVADALVLAAIGAFHLGHPMPFQVKDRHTTGLEAIDWPVNA